MRQRLSAADLFTCGFCILALTRAAWGVVAAEAKLSDFYGKSRFVVTGTIAKVDGDVVEVGAVQVLKAPPPRVASLRMKIAQPPGLAARLKQGDPVVVLEQEGKSLVHAGDTWLIAQQAQRGPSP